MVCLLGNWRRAVFFTLTILCFGVPESARPQAFVIHPRPAQPSPAPMPAPRAAPVYTPAPTPVYTPAYKPPAAPDTNASSITYGSAEAEQRSALPNVSHCPHFSPSTSNIGFASIANACSGAVIMVTFCYVRSGRSSFGDSLDCSKGRFGAVGPLKPGHHEGITSVPGEILMFACPFPDGALDLGAGVGNMRPVSPGASYKCVGI